MYPTVPSNEIQPNPTYPPYCCPPISDVAHCLQSKRKCSNQYPNLPAPPPAALHQTPSSCRWADGCRLVHEDQDESTNTAQMHARSGCIHELRLGNLDQKCTFCSRSHVAQSSLPRRVSRPSRRQSLGFLECSAVPRALMPRDSRAHPAGKNRASAHLLANVPDWEQGEDGDSSRYY